MIGFVIEKKDWHYFKLKLEKTVLFVDFMQNGEKV